MTSREAAPRDLAHAIAGAALTAGASDPAVRGADWKLGVVTAVNADGTVDVGAIRARRLEDAYLNPAVGDTAVITLNSAGNWLAIGKTATGAGGPWISYTPTWTAATTNPTLGNGTLIGRYQRIGRSINLHINLIPGSTTTIGSGDYSFALPAQAANEGCTYIGNAHMFGGSRWGGQFLISPNATAGAPFLSATTTNPRLAWMTHAVPEALSTGDQLRMTTTYEAAT